MLPSQGRDRGFESRWGHTAGATPAGSASRRGRRGFGSWLEGGDDLASHQSFLVQRPGSWNLQSGRGRPMNRRYVVGIGLVVLLALVVSCGTDNGTTSSPEAIDG